MCNLNAVSAELWDRAGHSHAEPRVWGTQQWLWASPPRQDNWHDEVFPATNCWYTEHRQIRPCVPMQLNKLFGESHTSQ